MKIKSEQFRKPLRRFPVTLSPCHLVTLSFVLFSTIATCAQAQDKPKVATFPIGGQTDANFRDRIGFAIREKLDRDGAYDPLDGPLMIDMASMATAPVSFDSSPDEVQDLAKTSDAVVLIWGDCSNVNGKDHLRLHVLDLRQKSPTPAAFESDIADGGQIRFVVEKFLVTLPGVTPFVHPSEEAVHHDPASDAMFATNPNLVVDGDFAAGAHWTALYQSEIYPLRISDLFPVEDHLAIYKVPAEGAEPAHNVLAMNMSHHAAENNGLAALSDAITIQPGVRYRLSFRYRSDGPELQCFVKGYTLGKNTAGQPADREIYRMQVPPAGATGGKWKTLETDLEPQNPGFPVQRLRVDLYIYLSPGKAMFDDVELKAVGRFDAPAATQPSK